METYITIPLIVLAVSTIIGIISYYEGDDEE